MQKLIVVTFIMSWVCCCHCYTVMTKTHLRELARQEQDRKFDARIEEIINNVIAYAKANRTQYSLTAQFLPYTNGLFGSTTQIDDVITKSDDIIITRLRDTLVDANITIRTSHCCKHIIIEW